MVTEIFVPDIGEAKDVEVIEILVGVGDEIEVDTSLVVLESDKASMEIPSPTPGKIGAISVKVGDIVEEGHLILELEPVEKAPLSLSVATGENYLKEDEVKGHLISNRGELLREDRQADAMLSEGTQDSSELMTPITPVSEGTQDPSELMTPITPVSEEIYAGPAVRKQGREYGVHLPDVKGTGRGGRILKTDIQRYVAARLRSVPEDPTPITSNIDFGKFGEIEIKPLSKVRRLSAKNLHRSWRNIPHVTQFDEADVTELEVFRKEQNMEQGHPFIKLTPLAFLIKASVTALIKHPQFNSSIQESLENLVLKKFYNIGIAVETEGGLVVPVLKDADKKGLLQIAEESAALAAKARNKALSFEDMQGATFTISSLGGIGGTAFTPIVNSPEVAILGVSRARVCPVFEDGSFVARTLLPLSLSYDHRAIDGADAARFISSLSSILGDIRRIIL